LLESKGLAHDTFNNLLKLLPSNYRSDILGPNYTQFMKSFACESARGEISGDIIKDDLTYTLTRSEFLFQKLGVEIHEVDPVFFPPTENDEEYRRFLLSLQTILLGGSTKESLRAGGQLWAESLKVNVVELFQAPGSSVTDTHMWFYEVFIPANILELDVNLGVVVNGLNLMAKLIKPAHTLFQVNLIYQEFVRSEDGCFIDVGTGFVETRRITIDKTLFDNCDQEDQITICHVPPDDPENPVDLVIPVSQLAAHLAHGDTIGSCAGSVGDQVLICHTDPATPDNPQTLFIASEALPDHLAHGDFFGSCDCLKEGKFFIDRVRDRIASITLPTIALEGGITLKVIDSVEVLRDFDGAVLDLNDLAVGDTITAVGWVIGGNVENGFHVQTKFSRNAVCTEHKFRLENFVNETPSFCHDEVKENEKFLEDVSNQYPNSVTHRILQAKHFPFVDPNSEDIGRLTFDPEDVIVTVNGNPVNVRCINPFTGEVTLEVAFALGDTVVLCYTFTHKPNYPIIGDSLHMNGDQYGFFDIYGMIGDTAPEAIINVNLCTEAFAPDLEKSLTLNEEDNKLNDENSQLNAGESFQIVDVFTCSVQSAHIPLKRAKVIEYNFKGFQLAASSIGDHPFGLIGDTRTCYRNVGDDFVIIDSRNAIPEEMYGEPDTRFALFAAAQRLFVTQPLIQWTQDTCQRLNSVFLHQNLQFIPTLSDLLNSLDDFINNNNLLLSTAEIQKTRLYLQDLYSAVIDHTEANCVVEGFCIPTGLKKDEEVAFKIRYEENPVADDICPRPVLGDIALLTVSGNVGAQAMILNEIDHELNTNKSFLNVGAPAEFVSDPEFGEEFGGDNDCNIGDYFKEESRMTVQINETPPGPSVTVLSIP